MDLLSVDLGTWSRRAIADGVVVTSRDGGAHLRLRPRLASRRIEAIARELIDELGVAPVELPAARRIVTDDGELGAILATAAGDLEIAIAATGGDPLFAIDGAGAPASGVAALVETLARRCGTGRGRNRHRMFEYRPPRGWRGLRRDRATLWLHPEAPSNAARITVFDARPLTTSMASRLQRLLFEQLPGSVYRAVTGEAVRSADGLVGRSSTSRTSDGLRIRKAAALGDDRYIYQATLDGARGDHDSIAAFDAVVRSFRSLPGPTSSTDEFAHFAD